MTVLRAYTHLYGKQVFYFTNIAVGLYCYLDGILYSWIIKEDTVPGNTKKIFKVLNFEFSLQVK